MAKPKKDLDKTPSVKKKIPPVHIPSPVKVYTQNIGRSRAPTLKWELPEWDLAECGRILDTEAYVRRAYRNKKNLFLKEGWNFTSENPERVKYIKERFSQMEDRTGIPTPMLVSDTVWTLIRCHNAFWVKVRKTELSGGQERNVNGKTIKPIAGYFPMAPETVRFKRDENGTIKKIKQTVRGKEDKEFDPEDVVHFAFDKREGFSIGTPGIVPVKDDIRALRRIEENVELLVYQHLFPLFHYKVGTETAPADIYSDGRTEVEVVRASIQSMPTDGCWVTPERHEIKVLGAEGNALAVDKIIEHFKQRIFTGLGQSSVDMGEGGTANRSTASTMSRNLVDDTKEDQREFGAQFYAYIIKELLQESTFDQDTLFDDENKVFLKFNEIDLEHRIAKANHYADLYLKNVITHPEMRISLGMKPFEGEGWPTSNDKEAMFVKGDGDWSNTNYGLIERDRIILQSIDEPGTDVAKEVAGSTVTKNNASATQSKATAESTKTTTEQVTKTKTVSASGGAAAAIANKNKPTNQYSTRSAPKLNKDSCYFEDYIPELDVIYKQDKPVSSILVTLENDIANTIRRRNNVSIKEIDNLLDIGFTTAKERLLSLARRAYRIGLQETNGDITRIKVASVDGAIQKHIERFVYGLKDDILSTLNRRLPNTRQEDVVSLSSAVVVAHRHRGAMIDDSEIMRAYNYGLASGLRLNGFEEIESVGREECCDTCKTHILKYKESDVIIYEDLPPLHPHCTCRMQKRVKH
jgi:hypothetical protein